MKSRVYSGTTDPTKWVQHPTVKNQIYIDVDTSKCDFKATPLYVCSLDGKSHHWSTTGGSSIYQASPTSFRINLRNAVSSFVEGSCEYCPLQAETAKHHEWRINWMAVEKDEACDD